MEIALKAQTRPSTGKGPARQARRDGLVPAVLYGTKREPLALAVDAKEMMNALHTEAGANVLISLQVDSEKHLTIAREIQRHPIRGHLVHVDFVTIDRTSKISAIVPIHVTGQSRGVKEGGQLDQHLHEVAIEALPSAVPASIDVDVTDLGIGDSVRVSDLTTGDDVEITTDADEVVLAVIQPLELKVEIETDEGVEPVPGEAAPETTEDTDQEAKPSE